MFKRSTILLTLAALVVLVAPAAAADAREAAFRKMFREYEQIRLALVDDSLDSIPERAGAIARAALEAEEAAKRSEDYSPCCTAPAEIAQAADQLAAATTLAEAREAFFALSKPLMRFADPFQPTDVVTVFCSMKEKSWLQQKGTIGNPYGGKAMKGCGKVTSPGA